MAEYDNTNRGALFNNDRREKDTHPNLKGSLNVEGVDYWISGWIKESEKVTGGKLISLSVQKKEGGGAQSGVDGGIDEFSGGAKKATGGGSKTAKPKADFDDEIPF